MVSTVCVLPAVHSLTGVRWQCQFIAELEPGANEHSQDHRLPIGIHDTVNRVERTRPVCSTRITPSRSPFNPSDLASMCTYKQPELQKLSVIWIDQGAGNNICCRRKGVTRRALDSTVQPFSCVGRMQPACGTDAACTAFGRYGPLLPVGNMQD